MGKGTASPFILTQEVRSESDWTPSIPTTGTAITRILPPVSRFNKNNSHAVKKQTVLDKLAAFFERYFGLA